MDKNVATPEQLSLMGLMTTELRRGMRVLTLPLPGTSERVRFPSQKTGELREIDTIVHTTTGPQMWFTDGSFAIINLDYDDGQRWQVAE